MFRILTILYCLLLTVRGVDARGVDARGVDAKPSADMDRSPVDLVVAPDEAWLASVNQTSNSVSLVRPRDGVILDEISVGSYPSAAVLGVDGKSIWVSCTYSGELIELRVGNEKLEEATRIFLGFHPTGIAVSPQNRMVYVALAASAQVACVDLDKKQVVQRISVGRWPRYLDVAPDGKRLVVGTSGDRGVSVVDLEAGKMLALVNRFKGLNIGHLKISEDGLHAYFPWEHYGENLPNKGNIRRGWVIGNRLGRIRLDDPDQRETLSLDKEGEAVGDAFGLAISPDQQRIVLSAGGTHELLVFRLPDLPYKKVGSSEHIPPELLADSERFARIPVGGRPLGIRFSADSRRIYVANYLNNAVQIVDLERRQVSSTIHLGGAAKPSIARQGAAIFYDARRSSDQWYSCHSCHYEGGTNSEVMDTLNDGSQYTFKTVLPLFKIQETGPWTWHGYQTDVHDALQKSLITTMIGPPPSADDVRAMAVFLQSLSPPPNPYRPSEEPLSEVALRGKQVFESETANCATCHSGEHLTDGELHDVGLSSELDRTSSFNTPSLRGVYFKVRLLHDGRSRSLEDLLQGPHSPAKVTGRGAITTAEQSDLIEYLKTL